MKGTVTVKEADRAAVVMAVVEKRLKQREAAERLGLSVRQVKRLARRYRAQGGPGAFRAGGSNRRRVSHRRFSTRGIAPVEKPWKTLLGSSGRIARARPEGGSEARKKGHF